MDGITLEELNVVIKAQTEGFRRELQNVQNEVSRMTSNVNKQMNQIKNIFSSVGKFIVGLGIGKIFKDSIISAMEAIEGENLFETVFGKLSGEMRQWSDDLQNTLGINAYSARNNAAVLFNIASSMGVVRKEALGLSKDMTLLSEDMASFYNISSDEAFNKIRSGLTGETEPLKALGILVDENTLKQYGYNSEMSNSEKIMVRYQAILAQTSTAQGDLARTLDSPANQLRILRNNLSLLSIELGRAFMPIVQTVLPIINSFVLAITNAVRAVATFMQALFGKSAKVAEGPKIATNTMYQAKNAAIGGANAQNGYNKALKKTGDTAKKTAKEVNRLLGGFDEINSLSNSGSSGGGLPGAGGAGGGVGDVGAPPMDLGFSEEPDVSGVESAVNKVKEFLKPLSDAFDRLKKAALPVIQTVGSLLRWLFDNVLVPFAKWTIGEALPAFLDVISGALTILNPLLLSFKPLALFLWNKFLLPVASWTGGVIVNVLKGLANILTTIGNWMSDHISVVEKITTTIVAFFAAWKVVQLMAFIQQTGGLVGAFSKITAAIKACTIAKIADKLETAQLTLMYAKDFIMSIVKGTVALGKQAIGFVTSTAAMVANKAAATAVALATNTMTIAQKALNLAMSMNPITIVVGLLLGLAAVLVTLYNKNEWFRNKVNEVWSTIKNIFTNFSGFLKGIFSTDWTKSFGVFGNILNAFSRNVSNIFNGVRSVFNGIISFVKGSFTGNWRQAWNGVKEIFRGVFNTFAGIVKAPMNAVIGLINTAISGLNSISFTAPDWVPFVGGKHFGVNLPKIPYLAKGGIIDSPTLAMVGEAGKEAVVPLENNTQGLDLLAEKLLSRMPQAQSNNTNDKPITLRFDFNVGTLKFAKTVCTSLNELGENNGGVIPINI